ncbi:MAG: KH domain-containing protein, partial [Clostridia bacterium]|nr:KH domain-containing protein [Clostridia bacterium]
MKDLLATIVTALVSHPDMVRIDHHDQGNTVLLEVHVDPEDMGKIIGKQGKRAQAIRAIM